MRISRRPRPTAFLHCTRTPLVSGNLANNELTGAESREQLISRPSDLSSL